MGVAGDICAHSCALRLNVLTATWELITNARSGPDVSDRADPAVVFVSGLYSESGPLRPHLIRYNNIQQSITKPFDGTCSAFCCCFFPSPVHLSVGQSCIAPYFKAQKISWPPHYGKCVCSKKKRKKEFVLSSVRTVFSHVCYLHVWFSTDT